MERRVGSGEKERERERLLKNFLPFMIQFIFSLTITEGIVALDIDKATVQIAPPTTSTT